MSAYKFVKFSGAGNDFILFDAAQNSDFRIDETLIRKICDRRNGIGADGVIVIGDKENYNFQMAYYNADGGEGTLCGNGARCAIRYAGISGRSNGDKLHFLCRNEEYFGEILESDRVKFHLHEPQKLGLNFKLKAAGQITNASFVDTGSPHVVVNIKDVLKDPQNPGSAYHEISEFPVLELGKEIRYHNDFAPTGVNVNFYQSKMNSIRIRTYERGVENETLACGTGSVAVAVVANKTDKIEPPIFLKTEGGDTLEVGFKKTEDGYSDVTLSGPAKLVFRGEIDFSN